MESVLRHACVHEKLDLRSCACLAATSKSCAAAVSDRVSSITEAFEDWSVNARDAQVGLLDLLEGSKPNLPPRAGQDPCTLFDRYAFVGGGPDIPDARVFRLTMDTMSGNLLEALWRTGSRLVIAGGGVLRALHGGCMSREEGLTWGDYDIDVWFCESAEKLDFAAEAVIRSLIDANMGTVWLFDQQRNARFSASSGRDWTLRFRPEQRSAKVHIERSHGSGPSTWFKFDLVLRPFDGILDVLQHFDLDCCRFAYDGRRVLTTLSGWEAWSARKNIIAHEDVHVPDRLWYRIVKYGIRGYHTELFDAPGIDRYRRELCTIPYRYENFVAQLGNSWSYVELMAFIEIYLLEDARYLDTSPSFRDFDSWIRRMCLYDVNPRFTRAARLLIQTGYSRYRDESDDEPDADISWMNSGCAM